jgi:hypothetical protein
VRAEGRRTASLREQSTTGDMSNEIEARVSHRRPLCIDSPLPSLNLPPCCPHAPESHAPSHRAKRESAFPMDAEIPIAGDVHSEA